MLNHLNFSIINCNYFSNNLLLYLQKLKSLRWVIFGSILVNSILKVSLLHRTIYRNVFRFLPGLHLIISSILEHIVLVSIIALGLWMTPNTRLIMNTQKQFKRKLYVAIAFPEIFKVAAVLLHIFDTEPTLYFFIGLLIISIQLTSLQSIISMPSRRLTLIVISAVFVRLLVRCSFHRLSDVWKLGVVS